VGSGDVYKRQLDLVVTNAQGKVLSREDHVNPHEIFESATLPAGAYKISIRGAKVPMGMNGKQPYALVVTVK